MLNRWKRLLALLASVAVLFSLCTGHGLCERQLRDLADGCGHHLLV